MPKMTPASAQQAVSLNNAVCFLRVARDELMHADCPRTLARVRAALKSAEGAQRHMQRRRMEKYQPAQESRAA